MLVVLCLAFALRVPRLNGPRFHPDEALFASFARGIAVWRDPLLRTGPVDKPPLLFYLQAVCYPFLGPREMAARLPNLFGSLLTVALTYAVTSRVLSVASGTTRSLPLTLSGAPNRPQSGHRLAPLAAALLVACSPLAVAFGPTAFTDPLMVTWGTAALMAAAGGGGGRAGVLLGLGLATKYQAVVFLPLVVALLWLQPGRRKWRTWARCGVGLLLPLAAVAGWDLARTGGVSLPAAQMAGYGGVSLVQPDQLRPRLAEWLRLARHVIGPSWLSVALLLVAPGALLVLGRRLHQPATGLLLAGWLLSFFLFHWLLTIQVWDRYLLPAVPVLGVLMGWSVHAVAERWPVRRRPRRVVAVVAACTLLALLLPGAVQAAAGSTPVGGDHGLFDGIDQVAEFFADHPYGTVLYDHWLSWELRYYLFDSRVYVSWFPNPASLTADLRAFGAAPHRYLVIPAWESAARAGRAVEAAGFRLEDAFQARRGDGTRSFTVYRISQTPQAGILGPG